jgi:Ca2+-binding RTX toxin-like protein
MSLTDFLTGDRLSLAIFLNPETDPIGQGKVILGHGPEDEKLGSSECRPADPLGSEFMHQPEMRGLPTSPSLPDSQISPARDTRTTQSDHNMTSLLPLIVPSEPTNTRMPGVITDTGPEPAVRDKTAVIGDDGSVPYALMAHNGDPRLPDGTLSDLLAGLFAVSWPTPSASGVSAAPSSLDPSDWSFNMASPTTIGNLALQSVSSLSTDQEALSVFDMATGEQTILGEGHMFRNMVEYDGLIYGLGKDTSTGPGGAWYVFTFDLESEEYVILYEDIFSMSGDNWGWSGQEYSFDAESGRMIISGEKGANAGIWELDFDTGKCRFHATTDNRFPFFLDGEIKGVSSDVLRTTLWDDWSTFLGRHVAINDGQQVVFWAESAGTSEYRLVLYDMITHDYTVIGSEAYDYIQNVNFTSLSVTEAGDFVGFAVVKGEYRTYYFDVSEDVIWNLLSDRNDTVTAGAGSDALNGLDGKDHLAGGGADDALEGGGGNDSIFGGAGDDLIVGGSGAGDDHHTGGSGIDLVRYTSAVSDIVVDLAAGKANGREIGSDTLSEIEQVIGGQGDDYIHGSRAANYLDGYKGSDTIEGGNGDDTLIGGAGKDTLIGGSGSDTYVVDGSETVTETSGQGKDTVQSSVSFTLSSHLENLVLTGSANTGGTGNDSSNRITGNSGNNRLDGGAGGDTLTGGTGVDSFVFGTVPGAGNADLITDFDSVSDTIRLDDAVFTGLKSGTLAASAFVSNKSGNASDSSDRIIYETDTGKLYFDSDGSGSGTKVHFATIGKNLSPTHADFLIF